MADPRLTAEIVAAMGIQTVSEFAKHQMPRPSAYVGAFVVYFALAGVAEFGPEWERFAVGFGALVLLAMITAHATGIVRAGNLFNKAGGTPTPTAPAKIPPGTPSVIAR